MLTTTLNLVKRSNILLSLLLCKCIFAQNSARVIGYIPDYRLYAVNQIDFTKLTHVNYSFGNPDAAGNLTVTDITPLKNAIANSNPNVAILLSIGGGAVNINNWNPVMATFNSRAAFISQLVNYTLTHNIAGIDVDLEWDFANNPNYSPFVLELKAALQNENKIMTAALPGGTLFNVITPQALDAFDFINIMAYDYTGPWQPGNPGQHSSYAHAQNAIVFWKSHVPADKLNLGVPFYSRSFINSTTAGPDRTFGDIVAQNTANADVDQIGNNPNNYNEYYNGRPTIANKVILSHNEGLGGIMIWEVAQDAFNQYSLLTTISTTLSVLETDNFESLPYSLYPNPTKDVVNIRLNDNKKIESLEIFNLLGTKIATIESQHSPLTTIDISNYSNGIYIIKITANNQHTTARIIKK